MTRDAESDLFEIRDYIAYTLLVPVVALNYIRAIRSEIQKLTYMASNIAPIEREPWHSRGVRKITAKNFYIYYRTDDSSGRVYILKNGTPHSRYFSDENAVCQIFYQDTELVFAKCGGIWYNINMEKDIFTIKRNTLSYGRGYVYSLQYHLVWCTKYRKQVLKNGIDAECKKMLYGLAEEYKFKILAMEVMPDHIHLLLSIPPKMSVSGFMGYLKGKSSLMIFQRFGNMKFAYRNREFWCKGYYVDTVGKNTAAIKSYIANQLKQDKEMDQISLFDPRDPFTGSK